MPRIMTESPTLFVIGLSLIPVLGILLGLSGDFPWWFFAVYYGLWI